MKLREFGLLTDENIDPDVVAFLRSQGFDVWDVCENGMQGSTDLLLLQTAVRDNRAVLTHDSDFGRLSVLQGETIIGLVFLRPGHINPRFTIETIETVLAANPDVIPPFILVAKRTGRTVAIRIRHLGP